MKKLLASLITILASGLILTSCTIRQVQHEPRTVTVQGSGVIQLEADTATITLSVNTKNVDVIKSTQENAEKIQKVIDALYEAGVDKKNISTCNYRIYQESVPIQNGRFMQEQYNVSNEIQVVLKDTSKAGEIIDTAVRAGANSLSSLTYSISNTEDAVKQARMLAIKQAEENASVLATANGAVLGQILYISEDTGAMYPRLREYSTNEKAALMTTATPIYSGKTEVNVTITATWELN